MVGVEPVADGVEDQRDMPRLQVAQPLAAGLELIQEGVDLVGKDDVPVTDPASELPMVDQVDW